jgi:Arm DNA-binding domain
MTKTLTQFALDALKSSDKRREVPDGKVVGLFLIVQPSGSKSWAVRYRVDGRPKKLTIGAYPTTDLAGARMAAQRALADVAGGADPAAVEQAKRRAAAVQQRQANDLVETVVATFIERYAKKQTRETSARETERILMREVVGKWRGASGREERRD